MIGAIEGDTIGLLRNISRNLLSNIMAQLPQSDINLSFPKSMVG